MNAFEEHGPLGRKTAGVVIAIVIVSLIAGYFLLGDFLFSKEIKIAYDIRLGTQYDGISDVKTSPEIVDVVHLDEGAETVMSGLLLIRRYTELILEVQGVPPRQLEVTAEYVGEPRQLWMHVGGLFAKPVFSTPLLLSDIEEGSWDVLRSGDLSLFQQGQEYESVEDFLSHAKNLESDVGLAGIRPDEVMAASCSGEETRLREILAMPLRGAHTFEFIVQDGRLNLEIAKKDLNRYAGGDDVLVRLKRGDAVLKEQIMPDDGDMLESAVEAGGEQWASIVLDGCTKGSYTLEVQPLSWGDDFVITSLRADAARAIIKNGVFLFQPQETGPEPVVPAIRSATLYLDGPAGILAAETWHPITPRNVWLDGATLFSFEAKGAGAAAQKGATIVREGAKQLEIDNPGSLILRFQGGGFSFFPEIAYNPGLPHLKPMNENASQQFSVILARGYEAPVKAGEVRSSHRSVPVEGVSLPGEKIRIVLEKAGEDEVLLTSLKIRLN